MPKVVCHLSSVHKRSDVRVFYKECLSLVSSGYKIHLVVADGQGNSLISGVTVHDVGFFTSRFMRMFFSPLKVLRAGMRTRAQVYHFHDPELLPVGLFLKLFAKAKLVYDAHESYPDDVLHKDYLSKPVRIIASWAIDILECFVAKRLDAVVTVTDYHAKRFLKYNPNTIVVCNYPLLEEWKSLIEAKVEKLPKSLCYVGSITKKRGISQLLTAIDNLDVTLHLAGAYEPAEYREELKALAAWDKVKEYGYISREKAVSLISQAQVGVMLFLPEPNHINSLSTKVFEYMAGATCVVVSDFPVYRSLIMEQSCGLSVNPLNIEDISNAIQSLLANPEKCSQMGSRGRELITNTYNWEAQESTLIYLYESLTS